VDRYCGCLNEGDGSINGCMGSCRRSLQVRGLVIHSGHGA